MVLMINFSLSVKAVTQLFWKPVVIYAFKRHTLTPKFTKRKIVFHQHWKWLLDFTLLKTIIIPLLNINGKQSILDVPYSFEIDNIPYSFYTKRPSLVSVFVVPRIDYSCIYFIHKLN